MRPFLIRHRHSSFQSLSPVELSRTLFRAICSVAFKATGGDEEDRTPDPLRARQVLSQLSYTPMSGFQDCRFFPFEVPFLMDLQN